MLQAELCDQVPAYHDRVPAYHDRIPANHDRDCLNEVKNQKNEGENQLNIVENQLKVVYAAVYNGQFQIVNKYAYMCVYINIRDREPLNVVLYQVDISSVCICSCGIVECK